MNLLVALSYLKKGRQLAVSWNIFAKISKTDFYYLTNSNTHSSLLTNLRTFLTMFLNDTFMSDVWKRCLAWVTFWTASF